MRQSRGYVTKPCRPISGERARHPDLSRGGALAVASVIGLLLTALFFMFIGLGECLMRDGSEALRACRAEKQFELRAFPLLSIALVVAAHFIAQILVVRFSPRFDGARRGNVPDPMDGPGLVLLNRRPTLARG